MFKTRFRKHPLSLDISNKQNKVLSYKRERHYFIISLGLIVGLGLSLILTISNLPFQRSQLQQSMDLVLDVMSVPAQRALFSPKEDLAIEITKEFFRNDQLFSAAIYDQNGVPITSFKRRTSNPYAEYLFNILFYNLHSFEKKLYNGRSEKPIGLLRVTSNHITLIHHFIETTTLITLLTTASSILIAYILSYLFRHQTVVALRQLTEEISQLNIDDQSPLQLDFSSKFLKTDLSHLAEILDQKLAQLYHHRQYLGKQLAQTENVKETLFYQKEDAKTALSDMNREMEETLEELQKSQNELIEAERMASLGRLVAGVSHEINTRIGVCVTAASSIAADHKEIQKKIADETLNRQDLTDFLSRLDDGAKMVMTNTKRAADLIASFKKVAVTQSSSQWEVFNFKNYIDEVFLSLKPNFKRRPIDIVIEGDPQFLIFSWPGAWSQIITNLVVNSLIHAFSEQMSGRIRIQWFVQDTHLLFNYEDNGIGMDGLTLSHIFDPFFTTKRGQGGSGLGMHIVYNLVTQNLKGSMQVDSQPNEGVHFSLAIPLLSPQDLEKSILPSDPSTVSAMKTIEEPTQSFKK